jgi:heme exporter protein B
MTVSKSIGKILAIIQKDLLSETRTRDVAFSVLFFAILVIVIFSFAFEPGAETTKEVSPGILWVAVIFAGVLSFNRSFIQEKEKGCLDGLKLCPVDKEVIYLGKMLGSLIFLFIVEVIVFAVFSVLFNVSLFTPTITLITVLATVGFVSVGILFSALSVNTKAREILLPILFFPICAPIIIAAIKATGLVLQGEAIGSISSWLQIMAAFDVVFIIVSLFVFEYAIEE